MTILIKLTYAVCQPKSFRASEIILSKHRYNRHALRFAAGWSRVYPFTVLVGQTMSLFPAWGKGTQLRVVYRNGEW